ncbi:MAG TPA: protein translocase subunit SecD [Solirubrobacterales bacterium]|nr:protein translocase subunit SecD [Solirubrobacterales bacterium]
MGSRRQHVFVLLFVVALVAISAVIIATKETKLGLDLQGGLQLVYEGQPTGTNTEVSGEDIEDSINIIEKRINNLGVSEAEVARLGEKNITVGLPGVTDANRAAEQVGTTAQLYFFDWEPNLIGPERAIGGHPGQQPPPAAVKKLEKEWKAAGRNPKSFENSSLIVSGAFPNAYSAALLAAEQEPNEECTKCSSGKTQYYLFEKEAPHKLLAGPEQKKSDLYESPTGETLPKDGIVIEVPAGTILVSELPTDETGKVDETAQPGWFALKDNPSLSGSEITEPKQEYSQGSGEPNVSFKFTDEGRENFQKVTREIAQRGAASAIGPVSSEEAAALSGHFAVILDNEVQSRPIINFQENPDGIDGRQGAQISGGFSGEHGLEQAQELATTLQIGALPIDLHLISETQVSATLGSQALHDGIKAGIIGLALVVIFLLAYYRILGLIAVIALVAYGVIFFALIKLIPITLTLPGIAGLVLTIGVAADSNIVIFERIKEEVRAGRGMSSAIAAGYKRGISTIVDANVVTLLTAFILFVLATAGVKGFAFTLGVGTITSLLTAVVFTQALLGTMSNSKMLRSANALGAGGEGRRWHFDFMGASRWFFTFSGIILLIGAVALSTKELNFGIDFKSGTRITAALEKPTNEESVRGTLEEAGVENAEVQQVTVPHFGNNVFQIESAQLQPGEVHDVEAELQKTYGIDSEGFESTSVGPTFGNQVAESAVKALIFSLLVILVYVALRFEPKFAVPVLIALFHDILITGGVYALTGKEVSSGTVAAFLTILGYSLYDTIIVFDRIRENVPRMPRAAFSQIVNRSMSEVLTRSLATSFTTLLAVLSLLVFGSSTLQDFAFAMLIGIASGTYSSIFIASPVLTAWKEREPGFVRRRQRIAEVEGGVVPAFADDVQVAKLADDDETEAEIEADIEAEAPIAEAPVAERRRRLGRGRAATAEPTEAPVEPQGIEAPEPEPAPEAESAPEPEEKAPARAGRSTNGSEANPESAERRKRNEERRAKRAQRRKGRRR